MSNATFNLVPTPSTLETSTGSRYFLSTENRPPNPPISLSTPLGKRLVGKILDALFGTVATINADTGIGVGNGVALWVGMLSHFSVRRLPGWRDLLRHRAGGSVFRRNKF